jgi:CheY-like chemotaxis protein
MTIFIVEDDQPLRETFADVLRQIGYRVAAAGNGREALEQIRFHRPTFIFVDLVMPIMNGFELIEALRSDNELSSIPIVAITASGTTVVPGVMVMKKPFRAEAAVGLIEMLSGHSARRNAREAPRRRDGLRWRGVTRVQRRIERRRAPRWRRNPPGD